MATTASTRPADGARTAAGAPGEAPGKPRVSASLILLYAVLVTYGLFSLMPFVFAILSSFKVEAQVLAFPPSLIPRPFTTKSYEEIFNNSNFVFGRYVLNSFVYAGATAALNVLVGAMAGYAFGRMEFPGKNALFALTLAVLMIPANLIMVPKFLVADALHITDSYWALILPAAVTPTSVLLMTQFLKTLPKELEESAMIDGASRWRAFWQVVLPLARPAVVTVALFQFQGAWNDFMWPLLVMSGKDNYTLTVGLAFFKGTYFTRYGLLLAGAAINVAPLVALFFIFQRYFMKGISTAGLAGR